MNNRELSSRQFEIIKNIKNLINNNKKKKNFLLSKEFFYSSWSHSLGYLKIKKINKDQNILRSLKILFSNFYLQFFFSDLSITNINNFKKKYDKIVLSWCFKQDFRKGVYHDRYFSSNSKVNKKTLWLLISMDGYDTKLIKNVIILKNKPSLLKFIQYFFKASYTSLIKFNLKNYFIIENYYIEISKVVSELIKIHKIKQFIMPYECQTFQNFILNKINKRRSIDTIGYIHSSLPPLPTDYIKRPGSPKKIIVHGILQKEILYKTLGWSFNEIILKKSARYKFKNKEYFTNKIFLPMTFENDKLLLSYLEDYFLKQKKNSHCILSIKNHPLMGSSKKHLKLMNDINSLLIKYKQIFIKRNQNTKLNSIFFSATASIIEALEYGIEAVHIVNDPILETHNPKLWRGIDVNKVGKNIYKYKLITKNSCINFQDKNFRFSKWIKN